jgi:diacylglycerol kinase
MLLVIGVGIWVGLSYQAWAILMLTIGTVLVAEMLNTALEALVDLASPEYHPLAKNVKDLAAGSVLLWAIVAVIVGLVILGPPLLECLLGYLRP